MKYLYNTIVALLLLLGVAVVVRNFAHFGQVEFTDNAHVRQHITPQNTRVQGFIKEIRFEEFQPVKKRGGRLMVVARTWRFSLEFPLVQ